MIILSGKDIKKSYGIDVIIENATFSIQETDKIGVIGVNGAGKTTLFKILTGAIDKDSGHVFMGKDIQISYMSQDFSFESENTIYDELILTFSHLIDLENRIKLLEQEISDPQVIAQPELLEQKLSQYASLQDSFQKQDGFAYQSQVRGIIKGLGFDLSDYDKKISTLSGGQKTRVALGKILLTNSDILLLDEPTNYLDIESVQWLEDYLKSYKGSILLISHDRYFLDQVTNRTFEMEHKLLKEYNGNYSSYVSTKEIEREQALKDYSLQQKEIERQEAIIARFRQYNKEKSIKKAESREKLLDKMEKIDKPDALPKSVRFHFEPKIKSGNDVLHVENLSKSFDRLLFENINFDIKKGERVALLGPNGIGKTTILKIILNKLQSDQGFVKLGSQVYPGYYEQEHESLHLDKLAIDEIWDENTNLNQTEIRTKLATFLFEGEDVFKEVSKLSGGERSRLSLLKLILSNCNFLLMDEPTNHLDIQSKEVLESALCGYTGTVLLISHDRYFLNKVANRIIELTPNGCNYFPGNYSYYIHKKASLLKNLEQEQVGAPVSTLAPLPPVKNEWKQGKEEKAFQRKSIKRLETVEIEIATIEDRIVEIETLMHDPIVCTDHLQLAELQSENEKINDQLGLLYDEWASLSEVCANFEME